MFTSNCYIRKNTRQLRAKLLYNGLSPFLHNYNDLGDNIKVFGAELVVYSCSDNIGEKDGIDCGTNEDLFLALATRKDDEDFMQLFVMEEDQLSSTGAIIFKQGELFHMPFQKAYIRSEEYPEGLPAHRASNEEIIKYYTANDRIS